MLGWKTAFPSVRLSDIFVPPHGGSTLYAAAPRDKASDGMWSAYLTESEKQDKRAGDAWKDDANGLLVFAGLLSVVVATFIVESYKELSVKSTDETTFLLRQISLQLAGQNSTATVGPAPQNFPSFHPSVSTICVNAMWLLSLVLSISCGVAATLMQGWARRYLELPQIPTVPGERARVRAFLYNGLRKYGMSRAAEVAPLLLHLSVFLFFAGLVLFFFTIFRTIAIIVAGGVGAFAVAYAVLTILPCIDLRSPYRTPISNLLWFLWHGVLSIPTAFLFGFVNMLHSILVPPNLGDITSYRQLVLARWLGGLEQAFRKHISSLTDGFRRSVVRGAMRAPADEDVTALTWMLDTPALADDSALQDFIASMPESTILQLMQHTDPHGRPVFRDRLHALLRRPTLAGTSTADATRLAVCLRAVQPTLRAYNGVLYPNAPFVPSDTLLDDLRARFAPPEALRNLGTHPDPAVRVGALATLALLTRALLRRRPARAAEFAWLRDVLGPAGAARLGSPGPGVSTALEHASTDEFVLGALRHGPLPPVPAAMFAATLAVLLGAPGRAEFQRLLGALVVRAERDEALRDARRPLRVVFEGVFPGATPLPAQEALLAPSSPLAPSSRSSSPALGTAHQRPASWTPSQLGEIGIGR